jgi:hypothetical protein
MAKIDNVRRECEDIGTSLPKTNTDAQAALAVIHTKAMGPEAEPTLLTQQLDDFRKKFKIDPKIAANYRAQE